MGKLKQRHFYYFAVIGAFILLLDVFRYKINSTQLYEVQRSYLSLCFHLKKEEVLIIFDQLAIVRCEFVG